VLATLVTSFLIAFDNKYYLSSDSIITMNWHYNDDTEYFY